MVAGRPTDYNEEIAEKACDYISTWPGSIDSLCKAKDDMPDKDTLYNWRKKHPKFAAKWWIAKEEQANSMAEDIMHSMEEMICIADENEYDLAEDENGRTITNTDVIQRSKLRVDARDKAIAHKKFIMARLGPKKWGDKKEIELTGTTHEEGLKRLAEQDKAQ